MLNQKNILHACRTNNQIGPSFTDRKQRNPRLVVVTNEVKIEILCRIGRPVKEHKQERNTVHKLDRQIVDRVERNNKRKQRKNTGTKQKNRENRGKTEENRAKTKRSKVEAHVTPLQKPFLLQAYSEIGLISTQNFISSSHLREVPFLLDYLYKISTTEKYLEIEFF